MSYATVQDLIDRFGEDELIGLTNGGEAGAYDLATIERAISDSGEEIDAYLASRYQLPLNPVPQLVTGWCCDLTRLRLNKYKSSEAVVGNAALVRTALRAAQAGRLTLQANAIDSAIGSDAIELSGGSRKFSRDSLRGF